ncbi:hypothetical protein [Vibrio diabolicus]|uniref:hypothetical protein n=1 Tax=Vibrio diabolicus TaxID=50719 RepID=UPI002150D2A3|nr:hypothetical protein [Vibrio diabolicus]MCE9832111.1 hypothetical protein [Vibrio diabolicus]
MSGYNLLGLATISFTMTNNQGQVTRLVHSPKVQVRTAATVKEFVLNHLGFAIMPSFMMKEELARGD